MKQGLLWFDPDPEHTFREKVARAAARHLQKYGRMADTCCVHPSALGGDGTQKVGLVRVVPKHNVLRKHFWVGREESDAEKS